MVVHAGERTLSPSDFNTLLRPHLEDCVVRVALADKALLAITVTELRPDRVELSWVHTHLPNAPDGERPECPQAWQDLSQRVIQDIKNLGPMSQPFADFFCPEAIAKDKLYHWKIRTIDIDPTELEKLASSGITLIGDAGHAMSIFAGEGGNHALVDAYELSELLDDSSSDAILNFVRKAAPRWRRAIDGSERDMYAMHQTMEA